VKFFSDHDVYGQTVRHLLACGHEVVRAQDVGLAQAKDSEIIAYALAHELLLVTRDKDFGALVFQHNVLCSGIIFLRIEPHTQDQVHEQLMRALAELDEETLRRSFIVIEANHYRVRQLP